MTNNLLDLSDFDTLSNNSSGYDTGPILELTPNLANEDTLNSNLNPAAMPFTPMGFAAANVNVNPFQDNFIKPQDSNQVPGMCLIYIATFLIITFFIEEKLNHDFMFENAAL